MEKISEVELNTVNSLTKSQSLLWIGQEMEPESPMYNMVLSFDFNGEIEVDHFKTAFQKVINESDALRTVFIKKQNRPTQKVLNEFIYEMEVLDFSSTSKPEEAYKIWEQKRTKHIFNLAKCLFDSVLIKISNSQFIWYFNQHHLTTDAWSTSVIYTRVKDHYSQLCLNNSSKLPETPQFQSFINYENEKKNKTTDVKNYWRDKLNSEEILPQFYNKKVTKSTTESVRIHLNLGAERSEKLRQLGLEKGVRSWTPQLTIYNIFLTTLYAYLYRVSSQRRLIIGSPAHNRPTNDFKQTIGIFIEIFPLITEIDDDETFVSLLEKVQLESNGFLKYAQPGASLAELNRNFNVFLNYITATYSDFNGIPMHSEWVHPGHSDPKHHLRVQIHDFDNSGAIQLYFDLNCAVFEEDKYEAVPQHFLALLDAFIEDKQANIEKVRLISQAEYRKTIVEFNASSHQNTNQNIISQFEKQALKTPNLTALVFKDFSLNYRELNERANQLAHYLVSQNIGQDSQIAFLQKRSPNYVISNLAALKVGATFVAIPSNYPKERIEYLLEDSKASLLIGSDATLDSFVPAKTKSINIDSLEKEIQKYSTANLELDISENSIAYLIYTSGSTGRPKGVKIINKGLTNYIAWTHRTFVKAPNPAVALFTTVGFDITPNSIFLPLICGGAIHVYQETDDAVDLSLLDVMEDNKVDYIKLTPSHLSFLKGKKFPISKVDVIAVIGEEFKTDLGQHIHDAFDGKVTIFNEYGPAEATIGCAVHKFVSGSDSPSIPIGKPIPNMEIYILDKYLNPVPQGIPGEIYIAGVGLSDGYWERPDLTPIKFVANPFVPGTKMYRTEDLARINEDGILEFLGRVDFQVKLNGHRIELGEIEALIIDFETINDSVVLLDERDGLKSLTAYFTAKVPIELPELQKHLNQKLPRYMIPSHFKQLEEFPLSSNGKVDRKILRTFETAVVDSKNEYVAPATEIEELIAAIWQEVLGTPKIGIHDNFLELGGESLMALRVASRIKEVLELNISLDLIFKLPTVFKISEHIENTIIELLNSESSGSVK
ncbi:amino acid adenylation domain-containing protein [Aurantibacter crassamenti]|uniref:non-ribosomal peptide synthetase n=1 Tax=Aurantibacter crassamenti TaxID=1837375 RepID=UPI00193993E7|nr:non-ribosomal peptide synthetase [Aurantibacter crassamenti]MBM1106805.1 amino acid adenylation domain-containing protein [Aurantibacter crassamenti]